MIPMARLLFSNSQTSPEQELRDRPCICTHCENALETYSQSSFVEVYVKNHARTWWLLFSLYRLDPMFQWSALSTYILPLVSYFWISLMVMGGERYPIMQ